MYWERRSIEKEKTVEKKTSKIEDFIRSIMIGCFAYIGYAVAAIISALLAGIAIDFEGTGKDVTTQLMFVVAFIFNILFIHTIQYWS